MKTTARGSYGSEAPVDAANDRGGTNNSAEGGMHGRIWNLDSEAETYRRHSNQNNFFAGIAVSVTTELMLAVVFATENISCIALILTVLSAVLLGLSGVMFVRYAWQTDEFLVRTANLRRQLMDIRTSDENRNMLLSALEDHADMVRLPLARKRQHALYYSGLGTLSLIALVVLAFFTHIIMPCLVALKLLFRLLILLVQLCL